MTLDEVLSLREELAAEFADTAPLALVQKRLDSSEANDFVLSLQEQPLRRLPKLLEARDKSLVRAAQFGEPVRPAMVTASTTLTAHGRDPGGCRDQPLARLSADR